MRTRLGLAPALLIVGLAAALVLHMSQSRAGSVANPAPTRAVGGVAITVADMDRAIAFYSSVLFFDKLSDVQRSGPADHGLGAAGARIRVVTMRLGAERIELVESLATNARAIPAHSRSDDRWFQHVAIVVNDIDQAYLWLRRHHVTQLSPEPQRLPDGNPNAEGIRVFAFEDPDGHALEILQFPPGRGDARWQRPSESVFLGIDHTGIVVESTERSLAFYRDALGLQVVAASQDPAPAPERSTGAPGGRRRITTIRASEGPAIELVQYLGPGDGRRDPPNTPSNDRARWQTLLVAADADAAAAKLGIRRGLTAVDPDGHEVQLRARK